MPTLIKPTRTFTDKLLDHYRQQGDPPADAVITAVAEQTGREGVGALMRWLGDTGNFSTDEQPEPIQRFFIEHAHLPEWADQTRMQRGMAFFQKHTALIGLTLGTYSLPYTYLGANGVRLLWLTERIKNDTARRLQETGEWVFAVNNPKNFPLAPPSPPTPLPKRERGAMLPDGSPLSRFGRGAGGEGDGIERTLKIRLIHAASRWFGLQSGRWNMAWGMPVNQEDMAGTNLAFSYIVLKGLRKMGVTTSEQNEEDYLHHINVVGSLNGLAEELMPHNLREAYHLDRQIARRQFRASEAGTGLTRSLLNAIADVAGKQTGQPETTRNLAAAQMRFFLGDDHANALGIPAVPVEKRLAGVVSRLPIFPK
ncbi:oxygenase MpaB family protein [Spirosoma montaniterrae]|uniref:ER-bound oxygenase mpaB/mpaB'/Rubber oxygenase catalytic domain-containing protein n=1 Tax=Spirosoma montaniterrae TaxID=1178516 RepID=A0A1P9X3T9_9BACT|nr:oxygenase MpaB family protein [Spirosoma montaniterrae]AQG82279.1 hypothetical protein AWR27_02545 [Spirosoma montaniterrae]